jgi:hypothetical protein
VRQTADNVLWSPQVFARDLRRAVRFSPKAWR